MTGKIASQNDLITSLASRYSTSIPTVYVTFINIGGNTIHMTSLLSGPSC